MSHQDYHDKHLYEPSDPPISIEEWASLIAHAVFVALVSWVILVIILG